MKRSVDAASVPVVFTIGDPHGIGPEVLLKALQATFAKIRLRPVICGPSGYLHNLQKSLKIELPWDEIEIVPTDEYPFPPRWGTPGLAAGRVALRSLELAVEQCRRRNSPLLVTAPVNKHSLQMAGFSSPGQTEFLARAFGANSSAMAFLSEAFHLLLITAHMPLQQVSSWLTPQRILEKSRLFYGALRRIGIAAPRLALCGLNPHASEGGLFGREEETILEPAVKEFQSEFGRDSLQGPFPSDTLFRRLIRKEFDGVVALYHDQGLIPLKLVAFESAVNVTLGLPLIRTSPDHGTAFDLAGQGRASSTSMESAVFWGLRLTGVTVGGLS